MNVGGVSIFDPATRAGGRLTFDEYRERVLGRLHRVPRLHQRLSQDPFGLGPVRWTYDAAFDPDLHLFHDALPAPGGRRELEDLAGWILSGRLERDRPLWENHFVSGLEGGRVAVIVKAHHALEDGLAGLRQTELFLDDDPEPAPRPAPAAWPRAARGPIPRLVDRILEAPIPGATGHRVGTALDAAAGLAGFLAAGPTVVPAPFNGRLGADRAVATWSAPLEEVREVHHRLGVSFNDVVLAITAGGLRRYYLRQGVQPPARVRAMVPVSTRTGGARAFGNDLSAFLVDLELGSGTAAGAAIRACRECHDGRGRGEATALSVIEELDGLLAPPLQRAAGRLFTSNRLFNLVVSNVRGLERPLRLLGARHLVSYPLMPLAPGSGLSVAVLTMGGVLGYAVTCDPYLLPEPERLAEAVGDAFRELQVETGARRASPRPGSAGARRRPRSAPAARPS